MCAASWSTVLIMDRPGSKLRSGMVPLQNRDLVCSVKAASLSLSAYRLAIATVRPRPSFATLPVLGRLWPIVPPSADRDSPALRMMSMKSGRWKVTLRALYGAPASFPSSAPSLL